MGDRIDVNSAQVSGAVVLVTGGQRGLGKALVTEFLARGAAKVYATARNPVPSDHPRVVPLPLDVTDDESVAELARRTGDVTIVVNNAGATVRGPVSRAALADVQSVFEINVFGVLRVVQAYTPILAGNGGGTFVNIHSVLSWATGGGAYGASKAAAWSLSNSLRLELAPTGIQVLGVHLGYADTDMTAALNVVKISPQTVAEKVLDAVADGADEVLVDQISRDTKAALSGPVAGLLVSVVNGETVLSRPQGANA